VLVYANECSFLSVLLFQDHLLFIAHSTWRIWESSRCTFWER